MKSSILHEFYYGNLNPNERDSVQNSEYKRYLKIVVDTQEKLLKTLNDDEQELLRAFSDAQISLSSVSIADSFVEGFCVGMKIAVEVIGKQL